MFPRVSRIVPILSCYSSRIFTPSFLVDPWIDSETKVLTSAIRPGVKFNMLDACTTQEMYDNGTADSTDSISTFNARVDNLFYQTKNGKVHKLYVGDQDRFRFQGVKHAHFGSSIQQILEASVVLNAGGIPTTWHGKLWRRIRDFFGGRVLVTAHVTGIVNTITASVEVHAITRADSDVKVVGYTLDMARVNMNRHSRLPEHA